MKGNEIVARYDSLKSDRSNIEMTWQAISDLMMPYRGEFFKDNSISENSIEWRKTRQIYDSTAPMAIQTLAASLHGSLTSPATQWFEMVFRDPEIQKDREAAIWLQNAAKGVYQDLQDSNFNLEANETYTDLVGYGSSILFEEYDEKDSELVFNSIPVLECFFEQDHKGRLYRFYRRLKWTATQIVAKFGREGLPSTILAKADSPSSAIDKFEVLFAVYKRKDKESADPTKVLAPKERPYGMKYVLQATGQCLGEEGGYYEMPAFAPRWRKTNNSVWGNSPAMIALPDVITLNELVMLILLATEKVVDPATLTTERGLLSDLDLSAGGLTVVRTLDDMKPYESRARFDVSELQRSQLQQSIRSIFYVDQLELKDSPAMTATEVQVRYELMQRLLGPTLGLLQHDFLNPMIERTFLIKLRNGDFGEIPEAAAGAAFDVSYTGPLARAQKLDQISAVERWVGTLAGLAEVNPGLLDIPDWDAMGIGMADLLSVPANYVRSTSKITAERKKKEQAQNQQAEVEQGKVMAETDQAQAQADSIRSAQ